MCKKLLSLMDGVEVHMDLSYAVSQIARLSIFQKMALPSASTCRKSWANLHRAA